MEENEIAKAANELKTAIALECGRLADKILGRPEFGSQDWFEATEAHKTDPAARQADQREWQLTKVRIYRQADVDPTGAVISARRVGATWADIGEACGTTRQAAFDRWSKFTTTLEDEAR